MEVTMKNHYERPELDELGSLVRTTAVLGSHGAGDTGYYSWGEVSGGLSEDECGIDDDGNYLNPNCPFI
jgi:hypothetical protein